METLCASAYRMDTGENKPVKQEGNIESSSRWRSQEFRKSIVKKMMNIIIQKGCPSWAQNLSELSKCVERFEEKVYTSAKDEDDYIAKISAKVKALYLITQEAESKHLLSTSSSSGAGRTANIEWQEQIYEKVQKLKSMYFIKFNALYRHVESSQKPMAQDLENCRHIKKIIENIFAILGVSKSQINTDFKEKLDNAEKWIDYIMQRINLSSYNQGQHSAEVQSGQHFLPPLSRNSREEIFEKNQSPQVLRTQNYHVTKQISQPKKLSLQQQPMAKQYSNSQHEANQMSITKGPGNAVPQQARGALKANEEFGISINTPGISASPMLKDCCNLNETSHKPTVISDEPSAAMQCLLTSMSAEALSTSIDEIREIVYLNDVIPPSKLYGSLKRAHDQTQPSLVQQGRKMSRSIDPMTLDAYNICDSASDSLNQLNDAHEADLNSVASQGKRPRITASVSTKKSYVEKENHALVEEIKEINKLLIDTEVVIGEKDSIQSAARGAAEVDDGLVVKFLFRAVTINLNLISHFSADKKSIIKPLWLLVPTSYPFSSPVILDKIPLEASSIVSSQQLWITCSTRLPHIPFGALIEDLEDLWMIAKAKLRLTLQRMNQPWSLGDIAISWEQCARKAILEYAQHNGGGTFSSKYGGWEMC
ncbi:hypothetical protein Lal_00029175 [Lupinus albus]|nr:hypothetical protein Lal_00029175 [Lupinus albus]